MAATSLQVIYRDPVTGVNKVVEFDALIFGSGTVAERPASGAGSGDMYVVNDGGQLRIDFWDGSAWNPMTVQPPGGGSVDNRLARWDGTGGDRLQNSGVTLDDNDHMSGVSSLGLDEQVTDPVAAANTGSVYTKDVSAVTELFYRDSAGTIRQLTPPGAPGAHAGTHVRGGGDEIDGDVLAVSWVPANYTRTTAPTEVTDLTELTAHLAGIDNALTGGPGEQAIVQARRTTTFVLPATWGDVTFDVTDEESDAAVLDHDLVTNTDRILIGQTGNYRISYEGGASQASSSVVEARVRVNDTTVIPGSEDSWGPAHSAGGGNHDGISIGRSFVVSLTAGDFISLQVQDTSTTGTLAAGAILSVNRLTGETGPAGPPGAGGSLPNPQFAADMLDSPNNANWAVNAMASLIADTVNAAVKVRRFDDTVEEGVGFEFTIPAGATNMKVKWAVRAQTAPGVTQTVKWNLYERGFPNNAAADAWSAALQLADSSIPTNEFFQYDEDERTIAAWGLTGGQKHQFEMTRDTADAGDTLVGDAALCFVELEFT